MNSESLVAGTISRDRAIGSSNKISVLDPDQGILDVIRGIVNSGVQEEAFYVLDVDDIARKHYDWKQKMPRVRPFYAVKCNDNHTVLETLASLGSSFDCASKNEILKVLELGVSPDRIIFANTVKYEAHIKFAASVNVNLMTFDNERELYKIKEHHPRAKMLLRIDLNLQMDKKPSKLFGVLPENAPSLIALAHKLGIDLVGISFHIGFEYNDPKIYDRGIAIGRQLFDLAARDYGFNMTVLDIGGGFPGRHDSSIDNFSSTINGSLNENNFMEDCGVDIIAEPGVYYVSSAFTLAIRIEGRRELTTKEITDGSTYVYYINDGYFGTINKRDVFNPILLEPRPIGPNYFCMFCGPTCNPFDIVATNKLLPLMDVGDWLILKSMGAYSLAFASGFNGFNVPLVYPVIQLNTWKCLKEKTPFTEDYFTMDAPIPVIPKI